MSYTIDEIKTKALPIAIRYGVDELSLFGSYARGEADEKSDLDFLIQKGIVPSIKNPHLLYSFSMI